MQVKKCNDASFCCNGEGYNVAGCCQQGNGSFVGPVRFLLVLRLKQSSWIVNGRVTNAEANESHFPEPRVEARVEVPTRPSQ